MLNYEVVLRKSTKLAFKSYVLYIKKEIELKKLIHIYLDNIYEMYISDKKVCEIIHQLEKDLSQFKVADFTETKEAVRKFFKPLDKQIDVEKTNFCNICKEIDYIRVILRGNAEQASETLNCIHREGLKLSKQKCKSELLFILSYYFVNENIHFYNTDKSKNDRFRMFEDIVFPKSKIYRRFQEVFYNEETVKEQFQRFWSYEYPKYLLK